MCEREYKRYGPVVFERILHVVSTVNHGHVILMLRILMDVSSRPRKKGSSSHVDFKTRFLTSLSTCTDNQGPFGECSISVLSIKRDR